MAAVELHQAFLWTCEDCGRDNFARSVVLDDDMARRIAGQPGGEEMAEAMESLREADGDSPAIGGHWCMAPEHVTCEHCGAQFEAEES